MGPSVEIKPLKIPRQYDSKITERLGLQYNEMRRMVGENFEANNSWPHRSMWSFYQAEMRVILREMYEEGVPEDVSVSFVELFIQRKGTESRIQSIFDSLVKEVQFIDGLDVSFFGLDASLFVRNLARMCHSQYRIYLGSTRISDVPEPKRKRWMIESYSCLKPKDKRQKIDEIDN